ncbi:hypothetical protein RUND412_007760 [Rhizina undulata]
MLPRSSLSLFLSLGLLLPPAVGRVTNKFQQQLQHPLKTKGTCWSYSYTGTTGPLGWHLIPECPAPLCHNGTNQSPIDVDEKISASRDVELDTQMEVIPAVVVNTGRGIVVSPGAHWGAFSGTELRITKEDGEEGFWLRRLVVRTPSEHYIDGEWFPVEVQGVWSSWRERILMTSVLFQISTDSESHPFLEDIKALIPELEDSPPQTPWPFPTESLTMLMDDFNAAQQNASVRTYKGSLTEPPCEEGVTWLVSTEPLTAGVEVYNMLKRIVKFNARINMGVPGEKNLLEVACERDECGV